MFRILFFFCFDVTNLPNPSFYTSTRSRDAASHFPPLGASGKFWPIQIIDRQATWSNSSFSTNPLLRLVFLLPPAQAPETGFWRHNGSFFPLVFTTFLLIKKSLMIKALKKHLIKRAELLRSIRLFEKN